MDRSIPSCKRKETALCSWCLLIFCRSLIDMLWKYTNARKSSLSFLIFRWSFKSNQYNLHWLSTLYKFMLHARGKLKVSWPIKNLPQNRKEEKEEEGIWVGLTSKFGGIVYKSRWNSLADRVWPKSTKTNSCKLPPET